MILLEGQVVGKKSVRRLTRLQRERRLTEVLGSDAFSAFSLMAGAPLVLCTVLFTTEVLPLVLAGVGFVLCGATYIGAGDLADRRRKVLKRKIKQLKLEANL